MQDFRQKSADAGQFLILIKWRWSKVYQGDNWFALDLGEDRGMRWRLKEMWHDSTCR
jgi:hypothetical protein